MHKILLGLFLFASLLIMHTYLIYPLLMMLLFSNRKLNIRQYQRGDDLPRVAVLIAAYNEEKVIREKIESLFSTDYPLSRLKVYIGSDASDDRTDAIISELARTYSNLELIKFRGRVGKISIINHLQSLGEENILVLTDANVIFRPDTLFELVKNFRDERVGIVAANIIKVPHDNEGIAHQEKKYLSIENRIKNCESNAWGTIMGAEGGCYAIRNSLFSKVPLKFIVDDFFITMQVIIRGKLTIFNPAAVCMEDVPGAISGEYRRKVRISSGNFQNLLFFRNLLLPFWKPVGFMFWSHKVLRWFTPFLLLFCLVCSGFLMFYNQIFIYLFLIQLLGLSTPFLHHVFSFRGSAMRFISHFYSMNFALLEGFFRFAKGIQNSIWQPIERDV